MPNTVDGQFSLAEMIRLTYSSKYRTRFEYKKRDVLKRVLMIKETELHPDRLSSPTVTYIFSTRSYPNYYPYIKNGQTTKQRKVHHDYDSILTIRADENGKFSLNSTQWKYRLGSQKKWVDKPPQSKIKSLYRETSTKWKEEFDKECEKIKKKYSDKKDRDKALLKAKTNYRSKIEKHKKSAKYLNAGDYNAQVNFINGDFYFRVAPVLKFWGHLYGRDVGSFDGDAGHPFLPKHALALIEGLMKIGILV